MANSRYSYVRLSELPDALLPTSYLLIRLDGKSFHRFSKSHAFEKPNDLNALQLMNMAAKRTVEGKELAGECTVAFGESDEFSKLLTLVTSLFTSAYVFLWPQYFPNSPLQLDDLPVFDGRIVQYCTELEVKDYFRWRQVDTHINNMYNTCYWALVLKGGMTPQEANKELSGTVSGQKNELLFARFGINYNRLPEIFKKGSILVWDDEEEGGKEEEVGEVVVEGEVKNLTEATQEGKDAGESAELKKPKQKKEKKPTKLKQKVVIVHEDLIQDSWWETRRGKGALEG